MVVLRARAAFDWGSLPRDRWRAVQGFRPEHDAIAALGVTVGPHAPEDAAAAIVQITRDRAETMGLIARALAIVPAGAPVVIDGQKTEGIDAILRAVRDVLPLGEVISKAHGKIAACHRPGTLPPEVARWVEEARPAVPEAGAVAPRGSVSPAGLDRGSAALLPHLAGLAGRGADLGAGWGALSQAILENATVTSLDLVEAEFDALEAAQANIDDPRARFHWADATRFHPTHLLDFVVTNPPFHTGRSADPGLGRAFIAAAAGMLAPSGRLLLVANRHLPYEATLAAAFGHAAPVQEVGGYKIILATAPRRSPGRRRGKRPL
ncbi:MAG: class I SAM-dependent methyltransferase [Rhodobacteraceae bacterium]|nr:class I SAM-dependent methyltransferase [Paracoccaceae bacterium]